MEVFFNATKIKSSGNNKLKVRRHCHKSKISEVKMNFNSLNLFSKNVGVFL